MFQLKIIDSAIEFSARLRIRLQRGWAHRLIILLLTIALSWGTFHAGPIHAETTCSSSTTCPSDIAAQLKPEEKAAIVLSVLLDVPQKAIGAMLHLSEDAVRRRIESGCIKLKKSLTLLLGEDITESEFQSLAPSMTGIIDSLGMVPLSSGVELTTLLANPSNGVKITGSSRSVEKIAPLLVQVPAGVLPQGTPLSINRPVVLTPSGDNIQRMAVVDARILYSSPDGSSVYILSAFCLDKHANAPRLSDGYTYSSGDQNILTPELREMLRSISPVTQDYIWEYRSQHS